MDVADDNAVTLGDPGVAADSVEDIDDGPLALLDQAIVLALCLDVKNHNPMDGLTNEEMRPYIARVMHKDATMSTGKPGDHLLAADWMTYSTALLVKAMLEFEGYKTMYVAAAAAVAAAAVAVVVVVLVVVVAPAVAARAVQCCRHLSFDCTFGRSELAHPCLCCLLCTQGASCASDAGTS